MIWIYKSPGRWPAKYFECLATGLIHLLCKWWSFDEWESSWQASWHHGTMPLLCKASGKQTLRRALTSSPVPSQWVYYCTFAISLIICPTCEISTLRCCHCFVSGWTQDLQAVLQLKQPHPTQPLEHPVHIQILNHLWYYRYHHGTQWTVPKVMMPFPPCLVYSQDFHTLESQKTVLRSETYVMNLVKPHWKSSGCY